MRALHSLYYDAVATMTIDHVNHFEREGVVPRELWLKAGAQRWWLWAALK